VCPQAVEEEDDLKIRGMAANILNKQKWTVNNEKSWIK